MFSCLCSICAVFMQVCFVCSTSQILGRLVLGFAISLAAIGETVYIAEIAPSVSGQGDGQQDPLPRCIRYELLIDCVASLQHCIPHTISTSCTGSFVFCSEYSSPCTSFLWCSPCHAKAKARLNRLCLEACVYSAGRTFATNPISIL